MKHDVPATTARQYAEDPTALLGNPWADIELPLVQPRRSLATVWPFKHRGTDQQLALLRDDPNQCSPGHRG